MVILSKYIAIEDLPSTLYDLRLEDAQNHFTIVLLNVKKCPMRRVLCYMYYNKVLFTFSFQSRMRNSTCLHSQTVSLAL